MRYLAEELEELLDITGISYRYVFPEGESEKGIQSSLYSFMHENNLNPYIQEGWHMDNMKAKFSRMVRGDGPRQKGLDMFGEIASDLQRLNPELQSIEISYDDLPSLNHFILGVTSRYHPDDIQYCLDIFKSEYRPERPDIEAAHTCLSGINEKPLDLWDYGYFSPETIGHIRQQIKELNKHPAPCAES